MRAASALPCARPASAAGSGLPGRGGRFRTRPVMPRRLDEFGSGEFCDLLVDCGLVQWREYQSAVACGGEVGVGHRPDTAVDVAAPFTVAGGQTPGTAQLLRTTRTAPRFPRRSRPVRR